MFTNRLFYPLIVIAFMTSMVTVTPAHAASTIVVPRDYPTIQAAVDAAAPGATISIKSGTYREEIVISKDLNLMGAGIDATIIRSPAVLTPFALDLHHNPFFAIVRVAHGAQVRISGLTISGPVPCGIVSGMVAVQTATLDLSDARISNIVPTTTKCAVAAYRGIQFGLGDRAVIDGQRGTTAFGRVSHVVVDGFLNEGLRAAGPYGVPPTSVTFADNVITAGVSPLAAEPYGIYVLLNAVAQVTGNTIAGGVCTVPGCGPDPINQFQAVGIFVGPGGAGTRLSYNHISGSEVGIFQWISPNCCQITQNTLENNRYFGIVIQDGDGTTNENTILGGQIGIGVVADSATTTGVLRGDHISGTSVVAVQEIDCCGFTATALIKDD
jgi:parallel beta-helix repeat protein